MHVFSFQDSSNASVCLSTHHQANYVASDIRSSTRVLLVMEGYDDIDMVSDECVKMSEGRGRGGESGLCLRGILENRENYI